MNKNYNVKDRFKRETPIKEWGPSMTKQEFKKECDINYIVNKAMRGEFVRGAVNKGMYEDVSRIGDYHDIQDTLLSINEEFMKIPPEIRARFHHDPSLLTEWVNNPQNAEEAIELGLLEPSDRKPKNNPPASSGELSGGTEAEAEVKKEEA